MRPSETLEHQVALVKWWRSERGVWWADGFVTQQRQAASTEAVFPEGWDGAYLAENQSHAIDRAETFWVTTDMVKMTEIAAKSMPEQALKPYDLPARCGFAWLEKPLEIPGGSDPRVPKTIRAIMWCPAQIMLPGAAVPTQVDAVQVSLYGEAPKDFGTSLLLVTSLPWAYGYSYADNEIDGDDNIPSHVVDGGIIARRFMASFWTLVQQKLTSTQVYRADRSTRRRIERAGKPLQSGDNVKIVTLRKLVARNKDDEHEPGHVEWSHQWIVDGHWRNQYFPSIKGHRQIFVGPYVKGPEDKPLIIKDRVYKVAR